MRPSSANRPHLIITVGIPGSGKSFFAEHFAETFKAPIVSYERLKSTANNLDDEKVLDLLMKYILSEVFKTGQTAVFDGPANTRTQRSDIARLAKTAGYEPLFVWLQTDETTAKKRATKVDDKHNIAITNDEFDSCIQKFSPPHKLEKAVVISGKHNYASQLKIVLRNLASVSTNEPIVSNRITHLKRNVVLR